MVCACEFNSWLNVVGPYMIAYLVGSIPFGEIYARLAGYGSLKRQGSGNIGATNAYRIGGKWLGVMTLASDVAKGTLMVWLFPDAYTALAVVMGHIQVPFFTGGKGIATAFGSLVMLNPVMTLVLILIWICSFLLRGISGLSSITAFSFFPLAAHVFGFDVYVAFLMTVIILWAHRTNIKGLLKEKDEETKEEE